MMVRQMIVWIYASSFLVSWWVCRISVEAFSPTVSTERRRKKDHPSLEFHLSHRRCGKCHDDKALQAINDSARSPRQEVTMDVTLPDTADTKRVPLISRTISIHDRLNITVWERKDPSEIMGAYWEAQSTNLEGIRQSQQKLLDPFGLVSWPGSVKAAQELCRRAETAVKDRHVVVVGAGVGVEAQTAAILGAKKVLATDIHPTTLQQLEFGVQQESRIHNKDIVQTQILDLFESSDNQPIPVPCDLLVVADVLYNEQLAAQVCRRCAESVQQNPAVRILITDSQRFVPEFIDNLNKELSNVVPRDTFKPMQWKMEMMKGFTGSGVMIDEDQTYDVKVHYLWIGLK